MLTIFKSLPQYCNFTITSWQCHKHCWKISSHPTLGFVIQQIQCNFANPDCLAVADQNFSHSDDIMCEDVIRSLNAGNTKTQTWQCKKKVCSSHTYNKVPTNTTEMCFYCNGLGHIKKNGFSWLVVLPKPTRELLLQAQLLGARQHNIKKAANMSVLWEKLVLNYSDILCGKTSS